MPRIKIISKVQCDFSVNTLLWKKYQPENILISFWQTININYFCVEERLASLGGGRLARVYFLCLNMEEILAMISFQLFQEKSQLDREFFHQFIMGEVLAIMTFIILKRQRYRQELSFVMSMTQKQESLSGYILKSVSITLMWKKHLVRACFNAKRLYLQPHFLFPQIHDGPTASHQQLEFSCGVEILRTQYSSGNKLTVRFTSDSSIARPGFMGIYAGELGGNMLVDRPISLFLTKNTGELYIL